MDWITLLSFSISFEIYLLLLRVSIAFSSFKIFSTWLRIYNIYYSMFSKSLSFSCFLITNFILVSSNSGLSFLTQSSKSWASRLSFVMVKFTRVTLVVTSGGKWGFLILEVRNNLNCLLYDITLSPILIDTAPWRRKVCFNNNGSSDGSTSCSMFSITTAYPNWIAFSRSLTKSVSFWLMEIILFSCSFYLIHLLA